MRRLGLFISWNGVLQRHTTPFLRFRFFLLFFTKFFFFLEQLKTGGPIVVCMAMNHGIPGDPDRIMGEYWNGRGS